MKNNNSSRATVKLENNLFVIQTYLTKDEAISIREKLRNEYRSIPKLDKNTFEVFWKNFANDYVVECLGLSLQQLADESEGTSKFESW